MIEQRTEIKTTDVIYPAVIDSFVKGWIGSGFEHQNTEMSVRRIPAGKGGQDTQEHVQIEIAIRTVKGKKKNMYSVHGSFVLTPEQVKILISALTEPVTY